MGEQMCCTSCQGVCVLYLILPLLNKMSEATHFTSLDLSFFVCNSTALSNDQKSNKVGYRKVL